MSHSWNLFEQSLQRCSVAWFTKLNKSFQDSNIIRFASVSSTLDTPNSLLMAHFQRFHSIPWAFRSLEHFRDASTSFLPVATRPWWDHQKASHFCKLPHCYLLVGFPPLFTRDQLSLISCRVSLRRKLSNPWHSIFHHLSELTFNCLTSSLTAMEPTAYFDFNSLSVYKFQIFRIINNPVNKPKNFSTQS